MLWLCFGIGCICGAYDGFFGPGTGTIYIALFTGLTGMEMVTASVARRSPIYRAIWRRSFP